MRGELEVLHRVGTGQFSMDRYYPIAWAAIFVQLLFLYYVVRNYRYALGKFHTGRPKVYRPSVALVVPCKGLDVRFHANIESFFRQDYDNYQLFFVVGEKSDPAYTELCKLRDTLGRHSKARDVHLCVAGLSSSSSQKTHNLLHALGRVSDETEMLAFADSDVCVHSDWLGRLVWPLRRPKCGVATGYRWFVPTRNNVATFALSAINGSVAQLLGNSRFNHAWGGSMAVRADDFRRLNLPKIWKGTLSDDLSLSGAVRKAGMRVIFVPGCLVPSFESTTWRALYEFARRQFLIARVYTPGTWWIGFLSSLGSVLGQWGTAVLAIYGAMIGTKHIALYAVVPIVFFLGQLLRAVMRQAMVAKIWPEFRPQLKPAAVADILGSWLWSLVLLGFILASAFGRTIRWRGIRYRLEGPSETTVLVEEHGNPH